MPIGGTGRDKENENAYESPKATRPGNSPPKSRPATPQSRGLRQRFSMLGPSVTSKPGASDGAPPNTSAPSAASGQRGSSKDSGASGSEEGGVLSKLSTAAVGAFSSTVRASNEGAAQEQQHNHNVSKVASRTFTGIAADKDEELTTRERAMAHQLENRKVDTDQMGEFYKHMFRMTALLTLLMIVLIWCYFFAPKDRCVRVAGDCFTIDCIFDRADVDCSGLLTAPREPSTFARDVLQVRPPRVGRGLALYECMDRHSAISRANASDVADCLVRGVRV